MAFEKLQDALCKNKDITDDEAILRLPDAEIDDILKVSIKAWGQVFIIFRLGIALPRHPHFPPSALAFKERLGVKSLLYSGWALPFPAIHIFRHPLLLLTHVFGTLGKKYGIH